MVHAEPQRAQRPAAEGAEYCPTRRPENTVAPAKAGAYHVCLGRTTGVIGPSLRWGDDRNDVKFRQQMPYPLHQPVQQKNPSSQRRLGSITPKGIPQATLVSSCKT